MKGPVSESKMGGILVHAKLAAKNVRAQRDGLLQLQLQLLAAAPGEDGAGAALLLKEVASGLVNVSFTRIEMGARSLSTTSIKLAAMDGVLPSLPLEFGEMPDEQLFGRLVSLRLPRRPVSQAQAFARVEAAYYAVKCIQEHLLPRCVEHLGYSYLANATSDDDDDEPSHDSLPDTDDKGSQDSGEIVQPDPVAAATLDLAKIGLLGPGAAATEDLTEIDLSGPDASAAEPTEDSSKTGILDPAPAPAASATGETPQAASVDLDQARAYLDRACTLANLAVKHIELAVTAISRFADPKDVASISSFVANLDDCI